VTDSTPTVAVIGGGITGLSAAWELVNRTPPAARVVVVEEDSRLGGKLRTGQIGATAVDFGPDAFVARREEATGLCAELGLQPQLVHPATDRAYVWARGGLRPLPGGLVLGVPTRIGPLAASGICSPLGLARAGLDLLRPGPRRQWPSDRRRGPSGPDEAVGALVRNGLGDEIHDRLADPLIGGINAGPVDSMSAAVVFPQLLEASHLGGSLMRALRATASAAAPVRQPGAPVFAAVRGGMSTLVDALASALRERQVELRVSTRVEKLEPVGAAGSPRWSLWAGAREIQADGIVITAPAPESSRLLDPLDSRLARLLGGIEYSSVAIVTFEFPYDATRALPEGTGFLVPVTEGRLVTACTWLSSKWPQLRSSGHVLLRASTGRFGDDRHSRMSDEELSSRLLDELGDMLELHAAPTQVVVSRWPRAFPQYAVEHRSRVDEIEGRTAMLPSMTLGGAWSGGVGIPACIASGRSAARLVLERTARDGLSCADPAPTHGG
jgi:protoporphyrinogen/coproporphyrinogen III oxidase